MTELFPTLKAQLEARIAEMEKGGTPYIGSDWWQYTEADQAVFEIEAARWPRMMMTWHCYEAFKHIADADWDDAPIGKARQEFPQWCETQDGHEMIGPEEFMDFAKAFGGLTHRESYATYHKHEFWQIRCRVQTFADGS